MEQKESQKHIRYPMTLDKAAKLLDKEGAFRKGTGPGKLGGNAVWATPLARIKSELQMEGSKARHLHKKAIQQSSRTLHEEHLLSYNTKSTANQRNVGSHQNLKLLHFQIAFKIIR